MRTTRTDQSVSMMTTRNIQSYHPKRYPSIVISVASASRENTHLKIMFDSNIVEPTSRVLFVRLVANCSLDRVTVPDMRLLRTQMLKSLIVAVH
jgi:hypothetical protein